MKNKGLLKYKGSESKGAMHYIKYNDKYVSLTEKTSRKVLHIQTNNTILIAVGLLNRKFLERNVTISEDKQLVKDVYQYMLNQKHTHYKKSDDGLVVLEYI